jgi:hypothetical protein
MELCVWEWCRSACDEVGSMIDDVAVATFGMHAWNETGSMFQQVVINSDNYFRHSVIIGLFRKREYIGR